MLTEESDEDLLHYGEEEDKDELEPIDENIYLVYERKDVFATYYGILEKDKLIDITIGENTTNEKTYVLIEGWLHWINGKVKNDFIKSPETFKCR